MIIKKNALNSSCIDKKENVSSCKDDKNSIVEEKIVEDSVNKVVSSKYDTCLRYIRSAIDCLSDSVDIDKDDKETIANLGVVALDVANKKKSCCRD